MAMTIEQEVAVLGPAPDQEFHPHIEEIQDRSAGLCANERCKKGPNGTRGIVKSRRAKYRSGSCRVSVCRRQRPKPECAHKPNRKPRRQEVPVPCRPTECLRVAQMGQRSHQPHEVRERGHQTLPRCVNRLMCQGHALSHDEYVADD